MKTMKGFKKITCTLVLILSILFSAQKSYTQEGKILMKIGNENVTVEDFLYVYHKNNIKGEVIDRKNLEEYLNLFINFKLKVKEAESLGLDTVAEFQKELSGYRKQLAQTLLTDKDVTEHLIREAYERMQYDIRASHILIRLEPNALPKDTLNAYNKTLSLRNRILKGEPFSKVAMEASDDHSARDSEATDRRPAMKGNGGDLGYFTALDMVYPFENGAYNTAVGDISMPIKTNFGYHLIKVTDKRPAMGRVQAAHILISLPRETDAQTIEDKKNEINKIYEKIKKGESFEELARTHSDDKGSGAKGGVLPWFGVNRMVPEFIEAISNLNINDISKPIQTQYGFHIIKLLDKKGIDGFDNLYAEIKSKVSRDPRANLSKELFIERIKKDNQFTEFPKALDELIKVVDDSIFYGKWEINSASGLKKSLFKIADKTLTQQDFAKFLSDRQTPRSKDNVTTYVKNMYDDFVNESCLAYEDSKLEEKNKDFRELMKEYRDGILLFELTDQKVWSKAIKDTIGLERFFESIKYNAPFMWGKRLNATIYICKDEKIAKAARKQAIAADKKGRPNQVVVDKLNKKNPEAVKIESNFFSKGDSKVIDAIEWTSGISNNQNIGDNIVFVMVHELLKPEPKKLSDVRGLVTAEYQNYLEQKWVEELKSKYKVEIFNDVFSSIK